MKTGLRLIGIAVTSAALFALSWFLVVREQPQQQANDRGKRKTTAELLIGTWEIVEQDPPMPPHVKATVEFTKDGRQILRIRDSREHPPTSAVYRLTGTTLRIDFPEDRDNQFRSWVTSIEMLTDNDMILTTLDQHEPMKRVIYRRVVGG
jgi:uncharacterized protein (TIGR03066 family)